MSFIVVQPFKVFTDTDGSPLEDGYLFFGEANLPAETNTIQVFWDVNGTIPAAQPIRTSGGYPINNGTPGNLFVNIDYSISVKDKKGSLVYSAPSAQAISIYGPGTYISNESELNEWIASANDCAFLTSVVPITADTHIDSNKKLSFLPCSGFAIANAITLTIDAQIDASDNQIFFCTGSGKVVATNNNMGTTGYPIRTPNVKAIWFGVIPDAKYPTVYTVDSPYLSGGVSLGQVPTGTDSSAALRMAIQYVQLNCVKASAFVYAVTAPVLHLPSGQVFVRGNNVLGNQFETAQMDAFYAIADAGGNAVAPSGTYRLNNYNFIIEGNDCEILWKVDAEFDILWDSGFLVNRIEARNFRVNPIVSTDGHGIFFKNKALSTFGTAANYANALGPALFDNVGVTNAIITGNDTPSNFQYRLKRIFWNEGYSRCDNFTVRNGFFNGFEIFWKGDNPEAVDLRFENNLIQADKASTVFFQFTSFFDGFIASGNFFSFKANNITFLSEDDVGALNYNGSSSFSNCRYYFPAGNRWEFANGLTDIVMYRGNSSLAIFEGFNIGLGGLPSTAKDAILDKNSSVIFRDSFCAGGYEILDSARASNVAGYPKITYDNCNFFINGGLSGYIVYSGSTAYVYRNAVVSVDGELPAVRYVNQQGGKYNLPWPEYYGTFNTYDQNVATKVVDRSIDSFTRYGTGNTYFNLPPLVKITSIKLWTEAGTFDGLNILFGNGAGGKSVYNFVVALAGTKQIGLELMPAGKCLMAPTNDPDYLAFMPILFNGATPVAGGGKGWFEFIYEPITDRQQLAPILGFDVVALVDVV